MSLYAVTTQWANTLFLVNRFNVAVYKLLNGSLVWANADLYLSLDRLNYTIALKYQLARTGTVLISDNAYRVHWRAARVKCSH